MQSSSSTSLVCVTVVTWLLSVYLEEALAWQHGANFSAKATEVVVGVGGDGEGVEYYSIDPFNPELRRVKRAVRVRRRNERRHPYTYREKMELLKKHNELRSLSGASDMQMMEWNAGLEREAQKWADKCDFRHPHPNENRHVGDWKSLDEPKDIVQPVQMWYDEIKDWTFSRIPGRCTPNKMCGHYTQVVWASSYALGCAISYCAPVKTANYREGYLIVCEYGPPGNMRGRYPFKPDGEPCSNCPEEHKYCVNKLCSKRPYIGSDAQSLRVQQSATLLLLLLPIFTTALPFLQQLQVLLH